MAYYHGSYAQGCHEYIPLEDLEDLVANEIKKIKFSEAFKNKIRAKAKELVLKTRDTREEDLQKLRNRVQALEIKRNEQEDNLLDKIIDKGTFKRKHEEINRPVPN